MLIFLFHQTINQVGFQWQVLTSLLWAVVSMPVLFSKPVQVCPLCALPSVQPGPSPSSVLWVFGVLAGIRWAHAQLRVSPEVRIQHYGVAFLNSLSAISSYFPVYWASPSWSSGPKAGVLFTTFCYCQKLYPNLEPSSKKAEREKTTGFSPTLLGLHKGSIDQRRIFPFFSFRCLKAPLLLLGHCHHHHSGDCLGIKAWENRKNDLWDVPLCLSLRAPFPTRAITRGLLEFSPVVPWCLLCA